MTANRFQIKTACKQELAMAMDWAKEEGWNPGLYDLEPFYLTDPQGYFAGYLDQEPVSFISTVAYDSEFAFLGFYIVQSQYRAMGYGLKTWQHALKHLPTQNIGLDGVVDQQENYKRSGFSFAYNNIRYQGKNRDFPLSQLQEIVRVDHSCLDEVFAYDQQCFPVKRKEFLTSWLSMPESYSYRYMVKGKLAGFGTIRQCYNGYKVGPLFADHFEIADSLFKALQSSVPAGSDVYLDVPWPNKDAVRLAQKYGMVAVFETARMYTKKIPDFNLNKVFGVTSFELG